MNTISDPRVRESVDGITTDGGTKMQVMIDPMAVTLKGTPAKKITSLKAYRDLPWRFRDEVRAGNMTLDQAWDRFEAQARAWERLSAAFDGDEELLRETLTVALTY